MKKLLLLLTLLPSLAWTQATTGFHRVNQVLARANGSVIAEVVPYANVHVTNTATGALGVIYSDPLLTVPILSGTVTADGSGNYNYYFGLNTCMTERISSPGQGNITIPNVCSNGSGGCNDGYGGGGYGGCGYIIQVNGVQVKDPQIANFVNTTSVIFSNPNGSTILAQSTGGGSGPVVQVNGVNLLTASPVNLINSSSITVTNPSLGEVQFTAVGGAGCTMQGAAGIFNVSNGTGGCVSVPADYGATDPTTYTFVGAGTGLADREGQFVFTTSETGTSANSTRFIVQLDDFGANSDAAAVNFEQESDGNASAGFLMDLGTGGSTGAGGTNSANWELDAATGKLAGAAGGNGSANMYINLTSFGSTGTNSGEANFEVSTDCSPISSASCGSSFDLDGSGPSGENFTVTTAASTAASAGNFTVDLTGLDGNGKRDCHLRHGRRIQC